MILREPGDSRELRFLYRDPRPELPAWHGNRLGIYPWGNRGRQSSLPRTGWCRLETLEEGLWRELGPEPVDIPAALGLERGVWFLIAEGIRGVLVRDERGRPHVYMLTQPASHYYQIMTRNAACPYSWANRFEVSPSKAGRPLFGICEWHHCQCWCGI